jgi:hypothetical protein
MKPNLLVAALALFGCVSSPSNRSTHPRTGGSGDEGGAAGSNDEGGSGGQSDTGGSGGRKTGGTGGTGGTARLDAGEPPAEDAGETESPPDARAPGNADTASARDTTSAAPDSATGGSSPLTAGWREMPFQFSIHKPYDLPESARHTFDAATNTHTFWVLNTDKPHDPPPNTTAPRTELRMQNDYTTGLHQFEADFFVAAGTDGPCVMQVFGGSAHATAFMLKAYGGNLKHYNSEVVKTNAYEKWMHLNVIHNADSGEVKAYIDGQLVGTFKDNGPGTHYFKCGVYGPTSARAESRFRNIKHWVK